MKPQETSLLDNIENTVEKISSLEKELDDIVIQAEQLTRSSRLRVILLVDADKVREELRKIEDAVIENN